jgi:hypothetical protein
MPHGRARAAGVECPPSLRRRPRPSGSASPRPLRSRISWRRTNRASCSPPVRAASNPPSSDPPARACAAAGSCRSSTRAWTSPPPSATAKAFRPIRSMPSPMAALRSSIPSAANPPTASTSSSSIPIRRWACRQARRHLRARHRVYPVCASGRRPLRHPPRPFGPARRRDRHARQHQQHPAPHSDGAQPPALGNRRAAQCPLRDQAPRGKAHARFRQLPRQQSVRLRSARFLAAHSRDPGLTMASYLATLPARLRSGPARQISGLLPPLPRPLARGALTTAAPCA